MLWHGHDLSVESVLAKELLGFACLCQSGSSFWDFVVLVTGALGVWFVILPSLLGYLWNVFVWGFLKDLKS